MENHYDRLIKELLESAKKTSKAMDELCSENDRLRKEVSNLQTVLRENVIDQEKIRQQLEFFKTRTWNLQKGKNDLQMRMNRLAKLVVEARAEQFKKSKSQLSLMKG